ncbi:glucose-6-phosphate dehydrogenase [Lentilactobacillus hilgardii]|jgi:glucose-6-phosphate 1-dehydrogenase|uniref:Glucose-6-phosphate 1-dehydrogenase n=1 Tax=Lentilactobacillus hilgardii TaxID=1588 RepID=A0A6P1E8F8_LENHI|nr:glucose-6-phosphate dehydrogenase [Lentilactobacillus hilgardii ATCC 27305]MCT3392590.1 glucose-6-phosphate dehydrogenase [Lentilactobacillus hilgardii]MCT3399451.1 glucose-6-phosphate dehydrogenase [Lentilactobacillus hilgardii]QHB53048.1 glucose-6-phosphate dehydrogenase [Lentilactobacillus hilgardii]RRG08615.1 MAG: glucose-6-phosphate dehydrogenase [Lactobacillus sp.]
MLAKWYRQYTEFCLVNLIGVKKLPTERRSLIMLFGANGDLAVRKLYPAMFKLFEKGNIRDHFAVIGSSRYKVDDAKYRDMVTKSVEKESSNKKMIADFASHFYFVTHDVTDLSHYSVLKDKADELDKKYKLEGNRVFYISMAPNFFGTVAKNIKTQGLLSNNSGFNRLVIEKPFGRDFESAKELNDELSNAFEEDQIFRIDHYLGKEMIQNIEAIRFGNTIFEALWNNRYIDNVQVTLAEKLGVEERAGYYDNSGALRDMVQNHIMQIVSLLAMEQPVAFKDTDIRAEKVKALRSLRVYNVAEASTNFVRGQYGAVGESKAYRDEDGVPKDSNTETFVAGKLLFDNYRWSGTPFYIRTGKKLADKFTRVDVVFKKPLVDIFSFPQSGKALLNANVLTIYIEPTQGFSLVVNAKNSEQGFHTEPVNLEFLEDSKRTKETPQPYERLIHDVLKGDGTNFASWPEVASAWKFVDQIRRVWDIQQPMFPNYIPGSMGPVSADELLARDHREWIYKLNQ